MASDAPVAPEPQGNSISAPPGGGTAPDPMAAPPALQAPVAQFAPKATGSASDAINQYKLGVLQATAQGGMQQQKAFQASHQAMVDARTQALTTAAARAGAVFGQPSSPGAAPGTEFSGLAQQRASQTEGGGIRIGNSDQHQADFKASAAQRDMSFSNYMKEVNAAIPLAQAAAYKDVQAKFAAQKQASVDSQYQTAVGVAGQQQTADQTAHDTAVSQAAPKLSAIQQQIDNLNLQVKTNDQLLGEMAGAKKAGITGSGDQGMKIGSALTSGATYDPNRFQRLSDANTKVKNKLADLLGQQKQIQSDLDTNTPAPKALQDYVSGLVQGSGNATLQGKATLGQPALVSGQNRLAKDVAPSDVARIMASVPGLKVQDATAIANDPAYGTMRSSAQKGLTMQLDDRGRVPGTELTPWDAFMSALNASGEDVNTRTAIIKEYQPLYHQAGRDQQRTAKQQKARS